MYNVSLNNVFTYWIVLNMKATQNQSISSIIELLFNFQFDSLVIYLSELTQCILFIDSFPTKTMVVENGIICCTLVWQSVYLRYVQAIYLHHLYMSCYTFVYWLDALVSRSVNVKNRNQFYRVLKKIVLLINKLYWNANQTIPITITVSGKKSQS